MSVLFKNEKIIELRTAGYSLREISQALGVPYTTVMRKCKDVQMTIAGQVRYRSLVKGIVKQIRVSPLSNEQKIRIMGHLLFDGSVYKSDFHYSIMYINSSKELVEQFKQDMESVYDIKPSSFMVEKGKKGDYFRIKYNSKAIYDDLRRYIPIFSTSKNDCTLPGWLLNGGTQFQIILLQTFWDDEGSISKSGTLSADLKSFNVISQLLAIHRDFGINAYLCRYWKNGWAYKLILNRSRENYSKFLKLGLFTNSVVGRGSFKGTKKIEVLRQYYLSRWMD